MSDVPVLHPGDIIHIVSGFADKELIDDVSSAYEHRGIKVGWTEWNGAGSPRIVSIIRGRDSNGMMAQVRTRTR